MSAAALNTGLRRWHFGAGLFRAAAFEVGTANASALLGDIAFSRDGNRMFAVQTNPGGLAYIDTSLTDKDQTRDQAAGLLELCASPTAMRVFYSGEQEYAAVGFFERAYERRSLGIVTGVLGGVAVLTGMALRIAGRRRAEALARVPVGPVAGPGYLGVVGRFAF